MTKYLINDVEVEEVEFYEQLEEDVEQECESNYDDMLDETNGEVEVCGMTYSASEVLKRCDTVAYRCGRSDYVSSQLEDYKYDLERGRSVDVNGSTYEIVEEVEVED